LKFTQKRKTLKFSKLWNCSLLREKKVHKSKKLSWVGQKVEVTRFELKVELSPLKSKD